MFFLNWLSTVSFKRHRWLDSRRCSAAIVPLHIDVKLAALCRTLTENDTFDSTDENLFATYRIVSHTVQKVFGLVVRERQRYSICLILFGFVTNCTENYVHLIRLRTAANKFTVISISILYQTKSRRRSNNKTPTEEWPPHWNTM